LLIELLEQSVSAIWVCVSDSTIPEINWIGETNIPFVSIPYFMLGFFYLMLIVFILIFVPSSFTNIADSQQKNTIEGEGARFR